MPSQFLSRFKYSPSRTSPQPVPDDDPSTGRRRASTTSSSVIRSDEENTSTSHRSHGSQGVAGSAFVEDIAHDSAVYQPSPAQHSLQKNLSTPDAKKKPEPLSIPPSTGHRSALGTPKLVLTEEGASPRSFDSSPSRSRIGSPPIHSVGNSGLGLGLGASRDSGSDSGDDLITPTAAHGFRPSADTMMASQSVILNHSVDSASTATTRERSHTVDGAPAQSQSHHHHHRPHAHSIIGKLSRHRAPSPLPNEQPDTLHPTVSRDTSSKLSKRSKKTRKSRALSNSSAISGTSGTIAAALAKTGIHKSQASDGEQPASGKKGTGRSPFLVRNRESTIGDDESYVRAVEGDDEASRLGVEMDDDDDIEDEEDDTDSDLDEHLPVTGFAVASNRRQNEFHALFPTVDEGDYLIEDYGCALAKEILVQGRLYVSENHLCFHANIFGWVTDVVLSFDEIRTIEKKMTALVIPNAIGINTKDNKYTFCSFISRDSTYDVFMNIWRLCNPNAVMSTPSIYVPNGSRPPSINGDTAVDGRTDGATKPTTKGHARTSCGCAAENKHLTETALDAVLPGTPEKIQDLMFRSEWLRKFLSENQKLRDLEMSEWRAAEGKNTSRTMSYIKPLNGSIGPKQTKCFITDEQEFYDPDKYITMLTTTKTPDVPSGGVFSVKTRTCFTWAGANSTKVLVTTSVEWTGKSWVKGIIEKSCIDGQKQYHDDLESGMRAYIKDHAADFAGAEGVEEEAESAGAVDGETGVKVVKSEAATYAAQQRKQQKEQENSFIQAGANAILSGPVFVIKTTSNILSGAPLGKEGIFAIVILLLFLSNVYTYFAFNPPNEARRARKMGSESGWREDEVVEAMRKILQGSHQAGIQPKEELRELERILDDVERRAVNLRSAIRDAVHVGKKAGLDQLD